MAQLKIKWNDDRVRAATTAILLFSRERLARGDVHDLVTRALDELREDPDAYKARKATSAPVTEAGPLTAPATVAAYTALRDAIDRLGARALRQGIQFNSLRDLDNWLIASLRR